MDGNKGFFFLMKRHLTIKNKKLYFIKRDRNYGKEKLFI